MPPQIRVPKLREVDPTLGVNAFMKGLGNAPRSTFGAINQGLQNAQNFAINQQTIRSNDLKLERQQALQQSQVQQQKAQNNLAIINAEIESRAAEDRNRIYDSIRQSQGDPEAVVRIMSDPRNSAAFSGREGTVLAKRLAGTVDPTKLTSASKNTYQRFATQLNSGKTVDEINADEARRVRLLREQANQSIRVAREKQNIRQSGAGGTEQAGLQEAQEFIASAVPRNAQRRENMSTRFKNGKLEILERSPDTGKKEVLASFSDKDLGVSKKGLRELVKRGPDVFNQPAVAAPADEGQATPLQQAAPQISRGRSNPVLNRIRGEQAEQARTDTNKVPDNARPAIDRGAEALAAEIRRSGRNDEATIQRQAKRMAQEIVKRVGGDVNEIQQQIEAEAKSRI